MDWIKATGWPSWRQQVKKAVVAMAVLVAAGALYLEIKRDYGIKDNINVEMQRDYSSKSQNDVEMQRDYNATDHTNVDLQRDYGVKGPHNVGLERDYGLKGPDSNAGVDMLVGTSTAPVQTQKAGKLEGTSTSVYKGFSPNDDDHMQTQGEAQKATQKIPQKGGNLEDKKKAHDDDHQKADSLEVMKKAQDGDDEHHHENTLGTNASLDFSKPCPSANSPIDGILVDETAPPPISSSSPSSRFSMDGDQTHDGVLYIDEKASSPTPLPSPFTLPRSSTNSKESHGDSTEAKASLPTPPSPSPPPNLSTNNFSSMNNTHSLAKERSGTITRNSSLNPRKDSKWPFSKLELELYAAKEAIKNAPLTNSSSHTDLHAPLYYNLSQFIKSYELMERMFRVYVYKEGREPLVHTGPVLGIYSSEGLFIRQMERNKQFRVEAPEEALAFFLPYSVANMVDELYVPHSTSMLPLSSFIKRYVDLIASHHPFWNRTHGGDHFFVSCHDWGPPTTHEHEELRRNAIKVVCNADARVEFAVGRDASLPEFYMHSEKLPTSGGGGGGEKAGDETSKRRPRDTLAFFAGQMHGRVRPELLHYWEFPKGGPDMQIYGVLPAKEAHRLSYEQHMRASKYCICPMGYEVNSPRIVEAIHADCVPVIIADGFVLPFSHVLDWSTFSIIVAEADMPSLKTILLAIPHHQYLSMQHRLRYVRPHFLWHHPPQPFDTFHMILHSVWTTRLNNLTSQT